MFTFKVGLALLLAFTLYISSTLAAFGLTSDSSSYTVDAGSANPLIFKVSRSNCDITSIFYRGRQLQKQAPYSHINSGLGSGTSVSAKVVSGKYVVISCKVSGLTHHYVVKSGDSIIYMATNAASLPSVGELRFIARLSSSELPNSEYLGSSTGGSSSTVEGSDVFVVSGQTRSKFYSSERFIDDEVHCIWGSDARACMVIADPNGYETSAGGPFMRDINTNHVGDRHDIYWYHNSGHVRTEPFRAGLYGPFALSFSRSGNPSKTLDTSFFSELGISGYVPVSSRGYVSGTASGIPSGFQGVVHWYNNVAQYWTSINSGGSFLSPPMKPGNYTMILYKTEFKVASQSVTVSVGSTTKKDISSAEGTRDTIWRIGEWDGQPTGFRNAANQLRMHPTDARMDYWGPLTYTVSQPISGFPMAQVMAVNNPTTIKFTATAAQVTGALKICVGTTLSFAGGRPIVTINSWTSSSPTAPTKIDSRGLTRGAYRGFGEVYTWDVPAGTVKMGSNTVTIKVMSGSSGEKFLSPNFVSEPGF